MWQTSSTPPVLPADRNLLIGAWRDKAAELERVKAAELELRTAVVAQCFPNPAEGVNSFPLGSGWTLKATMKYNYNLANRQGETVKVINEMAALGEAEQFIASRLVHWIPDLSISQYRKLPAHLGLMLAPVLTIKPGTPQLVLVEPKGA